MRITGRDKRRGGCDSPSRVSRSHGDLCEHQSLPTAVVAYDGETGRIDLAALAAAVTDETAAVLVQSPNFFGVIEDIPSIAEIAHAKVLCSSSPSLRRFRSASFARPSRPTSSAWRRSPSAWRSVMAAPSAESSQPKRSTFVRCQAGSSARPSTALDIAGCTNPVNARTAHPPRKSDLEYLYQSSLGRVDGDDLPQRLRQEGP